MELTKERSYASPDRRADIGGPIIQNGA